MAVRLPQREKLRRRGAVLIEFIVAAPILIIVMIAIIEFAYLSLLTNAVASASSEAARETAKYGGNIDNAVDAINQTLGIYGLSLVNASAAPGLGEVRLSLRGNGLNTDLGNSDVQCTYNGTDLSASHVRATVCIDLTGANGPVPDLLASFGFSLADKRLQATGFATIE